MKRSLYVLSALAALWATGALADDSSTSTSQVPGISASSETTTQAVSPTPKKFPLNVVASNDFFGPALTSPTSRQTADFSQGAETGLTSRHQVGMTYMVNDNTLIAPMLDFFLHYTVPDEIGDSKRDFTWYDCYVKVAHTGITEGKIGNNTLALDGDVRYLLPTDLASRNNDSRGSFRISLDPSLQIAHSNFSFSMVNYVRYYLYRAPEEVPTAHQWWVYTGPQVNYAVSDRVTTFMLLEAIDIFDNQGHSLTTQQAPSLTDLEPGVSITINKNVQITPYLNWYLNQPIDTTSMNINATFKML